MSLEVDSPDSAAELLDDILDLRPRRLSEAEIRRLEGHAAVILGALGLDLRAAETAATPRRFIQALIDLTEGFEGDPKLVRTFDAPRATSSAALNQIVEGPIPFFSLCEHHALPMDGQAYLGYVADDRLVGISKLSRLVQVCSRRFTLQERLADQLADALEATIHPRGIAVYLEARHSCVRARGAREVPPLTRTIVWRGAYEASSSLRSEFLALVPR